MEQLTLKQITDEHEIFLTMKECDDAFEKSILKRDDFHQLYRKISKYAVFLRAQVDCNIAGYAAMYANDSDTKTAYLTLIGVKEDYRKQHIGTKMLEMCENIAKENGMQRLRLEVRNANKGAIKFYLRNGYTLEAACSDNSTYMIREM